MARIIMSRCLPDEFMLKMLFSLYIYVIDTRNGESCSYSIKSEKELPKVVWTQ